MLVSVIDSLEELDRLQDAWDAVYEADEHAHIFQSWPWLRLWFANSPNRPVVLAVRPAAGEPWAAFCSLESSVHRWRSLRSFRRLRLGGKPFADYTGFLCAPEHGTAPLSALACHLQVATPWDRLLLEDVVDPRLNHFLCCFPGGSYALEVEKCLASPRIQLPASWEEFLQGHLSAKARFHLRKSMRGMSSLPGFRTTGVEADDWESHLELLMDLWQRRHGKPPQASLERYRRTFANARHSAQLWLKMAWDGEVPMVGLAAFVDRRKKGFYCFMTAFNPDYEHLSPGKALFGYAIQEAITEGFEIFDLLRGRDHYKTSRLGAGERMAVTMTLTRKRRIPLPVRVAPSGPDRPRDGALSRRGQQILLGKARNGDGNLWPGDIVRVRQLTDILGTLDDRGSCRGCGFTAPMTRFCGREFPVLKEVERHFDHARGSMLTSKGVYLLEEACCDGSAFPAAGGCDRSCLHLWRREWLEPVTTRESAAGDSERDPEGPLPAGAGLEHCQLRAGCSGRPERWPWRLRREEQVIRSVLAAAGRRLGPGLSAALGVLASPILRVFRPAASPRSAAGDSPASSGSQKKAHAPSPPPSSFHPGTLVQVRAWPEIESSLEAEGGVQACVGSQALQRFCGQQYRVAHKVDQYYNPAGDRLLPCQALYLLAGVRCDGAGNPQTAGCDRACYLFWRAEWLEPVEQPMEAADTDRSSESHTAGKSI
jgi:CelD/BcsL family acetyltransferase involved in cellulose biosynthesis